MDISLGYTSMRLSELLFYIDCSWVHKVCQPLHPGHTVVAGGQRVSGHRLDVRVAGAADANLLAHRVMVDFEDVPLG